MHVRLLVPALRQRRLLRRLVELRMERLQLVNYRIEAVREVLREILLELVAQPRCQLEKLNLPVLPVVVPRAHRSLRPSDKLTVQLLQLDVVYLCDQHDKRVAHLVLDLVRQKYSLLRLRVDVLLSRIVEQPHELFPEAQVVHAHLSEVALLNQPS